MLLSRLIRASHVADELLESSELIAVRQVGMKEIGKLERMGEQHPGAASVRSYVELIAELPWQKKAAQLLREDGTQLHQPPVSLESVKQALDSGHQVSPLPYPSPVPSRPFACALCVLIHFC
jgi:hypothetical protein